MAHGSNILSRDGVETEVYYQFPINTDWTEARQAEVQAGTSACWPRYLVSWTRYLVSLDSVPRLLDSVPRRAWPDSVPRRAWPDSVPRLMDSVPRLMDSVLVIWDLLMVRRCRSPSPSPSPSPSQYDEDEDEDEDEDGYWSCTGTGRVLVGHVPGHVPCPGTSCRSMLHRLQGGCGSAGMQGKSPPAMGGLCMPSPTRPMDSSVWSLLVLGLDSSLDSS